MGTPRRVKAVSWGLGVCLLAMGCSSGGARAPNPTKPIDERRAVEVIARAMRDGRLDPAAGRDERLGGKTIHIDVGVQGKLFGVAYITADEAQQLGDAIPTPNHKDEKLKLVPVGERGKAYVLLLFQQNYLYDDLAGAAHTQTMITAEGALARDVRDFVSYAKSKGFE